MAVFAASSKYQVQGRVGGAGFNPPDTVLAGPLRLGRLDGCYNADPVPRPIAQAQTKQPPRSEPRRTGKASFATGEKKARRRLGGSQRRLREYK